MVESEETRGRAALVATQSGRLTRRRETLEPRVADDEPTGNLGTWRAGKTDTFENGIPG